MNNPVIFVGMHRSGTSLIGGLLERLGLFVGTRKDENNEALYFQRLNDWLLLQSGATWDRPEGIRDLFALEPVIRWTESYLRTLCESPRAIEFLGCRRFLGGGFRGLRGAWGWKDPRNTYTLPMWLRIFPDAKVIYIKRHGVDVAQSLRRRALKGLQNSVDKYERYGSLLFLKPKRGGFVDSPRCVSLEGGLALWAEYMNEAQRNLQQIPETRLLRIRYEDLLQRPEPHIRASAAFCGLSPSDADLKRTISIVKAEKALSYLADPELSAFAHAHRNQIRQFGYEE